MSIKRDLRRWWRRRPPVQKLAIIAGLAVVLFGGEQQAAHVAAAPSTSSANVTLGQQLAASYGWGSGQQWTCLDELWNQESGWSSTADNQQSGAYGIAQSLHGTPGDEYSTSDPQGLTPAQLTAANDGSAPAQIKWGLSYISSTYGTPCNAWAHETTDGWY